ncbi:MAG: hypothetical protein DWH80_03335 [Planctomycetota bacterium]|nr:MAG: hypothetical protein DWH80_03335 [Planctomycetota bacterium]
MRLEKPSIDKRFRLREIPTSGFEPHNQFGRFQIFPRLTVQKVYRNRPMLQPAALSQAMRIGERSGIHRKPHEKQICPESRLLVTQLQ